MIDNLSAPDGHAIARRGTNRIETNGVRHVRCDARGVGGGRRPTLKSSANSCQPRGAGEPARDAAGLSRSDCGGQQRRPHQRDSHGVCAATSGGPQSASIQQPIAGRIRAECRDPGLGPVTCRARLAYGRRPSRNRARGRAPPRVRWSWSGRGAHENPGARMKRGLFRWRTGGEGPPGCRPPSGRARIWPRTAVGRGNKLSARSCARTVPRT